jgi:hypothetical protein
LPSTGSDPTADHVSRRAEPRGLLSRDDAELASEEPGDAMLRRFIGYSCVHLTHHQPMN